MPALRPSRPPPPQSDNDYDGRQDEQVSKSIRTIHSRTLRLPCAVRQPSGDWASSTGQHVFQVHGIDANEKVVVRKRLRRSQVIAYFAVPPPLPYRHGGLCYVAPLGARAGCGDAIPEQDHASLCCYHRVCHTHSPTRARMASKMSRSVRASGLVIAGPSAYPSLPDNFPEIAPVPSHSLASDGSTNPHRHPATFVATGRSCTNSPITTMMPSRTRRFISALSLV
jgi:hypothetical protein